jgi:transcription antitermination factor NusA-like protein
VDINLDILDTVLDNVDNFGTVVDNSGQPIRTVSDKLNRVLDINSFKKDNAIESI